MKNGKATWGVFALLLVLGALLYLVSFAVPFQWDDVPNIEENPAIYRQEGFGRVFDFWPTRWVLFGTLALNYRLGGGDVFGYHLFNLLVHIFSAFLVYLIYCEFSGEERGEEVQRTALLAALIFLAHPLQTQSVTYLIQRGSSLSGFFCLLSLFAYIRFRRGGPRLAYGLAWFSGLLGVFSKEGAAALPLLLLLWECVFGGGRSRRARLKLWAPFLLLPLLLLLVGFWSVGTGRSTDYYAFNLTTRTSAFNLADGGSPVSSRSVYFFTQLNAVRTYLRLLFLPVGQSPRHDFPVAASFWRFSTVLSALLISGLVLAAVRSAKSAKEIAFGAGFFLIALLPTSSVFILWPLISENHLYLPLAGFAWAVSRIFSGLLPPARWRTGRLIAGALVLSLAVLTVSRNLVWLKPVTLWRDASRKAPDLPSLHNFLASSYIREGKYGPALEECRRVLQLDPGFDVDQNLWAVYHNLGLYPEAEAPARRRVEKHPQNGPARRALAMTLIELGRREEAREELCRSLELRPEQPKAHFCLGRISHREEKYGEARDRFRRALELDPRFREAANELGNTYLALGETGKAADSYRRALRADPGYSVARFNLARIYWMEGGYEEAYREMMIIEETVGNPELREAVRGYLAMLRREMGRAGKSGPSSADVFPPQDGAEGL